MKTENLTWEEVKSLPDNIYFRCDHYEGLFNIVTFNDGYKNLKCTSPYMVDGLMALNIQLQNSWEIHPASLEAYKKHCESKSAESDIQDSGIKNQECEHENMVDLHDEKTGLFKDTFECQTCGHLQKSNNLPVTYHSGKDALDKLMRGECDYIVFDDKEWIEGHRSVSLNCYGGPQSSGPQYASWAIERKNYLQTKWLCIKEEK